MHNTLTALAALCLSLGFASASSAEPAPEIRRVDACVYGGTSAGVIAAVAVKKEGKSVLLIEPGRHLGGMSSGGLGFTDFGNKAVIGGLSLDFYRRVGKEYGKADAWWTFEPHVAEKVFRGLVAENNVDVLFEHRLRPRGAAKDGAKITRATFEHAPPQDTGAPSPAALPGSAAVVVEAKVFLDCTYEGDLLAAASVSYTVGRESSAQYGEPLNGIRPTTPKHQFLAPVDPYLKPGDPTSGLLPLIQPGDGGKPGDGDRRVQTYNFRLCLTQKTGNRIPITAPKGYDPARYELLARHVESLVKIDKLPRLNTHLLKFDMVTAEKPDINNQGAVSTDYIGMNYDYPEGDYATRGRIWNDHLSYTQGLLYFLATSERVPEHIRKEMASWGLCKDEFADTGHWPHQMYVREARRMVGPYVITQADCEHKKVADDSVGMGAYNMDSHNCQRIVQDGVTRNEGDVQVSPTGPYPVSYRALTPKKAECENLLVPVCFSSSHIAYGSARMEPVFMVLAQSAALAACRVIDKGSAVQDVEYPALRGKLLAAGQVLEYMPPPRKSK